MKKNIIIIITLFACTAMQVNAQVNFRGIGDVTNYHPADFHGSAGPNHIVSIANLAYQVFNKSGNAITNPVADSTFFSSLHSEGIPRRDGRVLYDAIGHRWIFVILYAPSMKENPDGFFIAISETDDPTGTWNMWAVPTNPIDFPMLGYNSSFICISNDVSEELYVFDKTFMYAASSSDTPIYTTFATPKGIWQPCQTYDSAENNLYVVSTQNRKTGTLGLLRIGGTHSNPSFASLPSVTNHTSWTSPASLTYPQKGTSFRVLAGGQDGIMSAVYANGNLWCVNAIGLTAPTRGGIEWWQINPAQSTVIASGQIQDGTGFYDYTTPSIAVDSQNNFLIGLSIFCNTCYISAGYSLNGDSVTTYFTGLGFITKGNWGDYSNTCIDPVNNSFWTVQGYVDTNGDWATRWVNVIPAPQLFKRIR